MSAGRQGGNTSEQIDPRGLWNSWILYFFGARAGHGVPGLGGALRRARLPRAVAGVVHAQQAAGCPGAGAVGTPGPGAVRGQVGLVQRLGVGRVGRRREVVPRRSAEEKAGWGEEREGVTRGPGRAGPRLPVSEQKRRDRWGSQQRGNPRWFGSRAGEQGRSLSCPHLCQLGSAQTMPSGRSQSEDATCTLGSPWVTRQSGSAPAAGVPVAEPPAWCLTEPLMSHGTWGSY